MPSCVRTDCHHSGKVTVSQLRRGPLGLGSKHHEPQGFELPDRSALFLFRIAFGEVIGTQIGVDCFGIGQKMIDHNQDGMCHGDDRTLFTTAGAQAEVLRIKVRSRGVGGAPGGFDEGGTQPILPAPCLAAAPLAAGDIVAGQRQAQDAKCSAVGNRATVAPISAKMTSAVRRSTPGSHPTAGCWPRVVPSGSESVHREWRFPRSTGRGGAATGPT